MAQRPNHATRSGGTSRGARTPRGVACAGLLRQAKVFPDLLPVELSTDDLGGRDAALAHMIYDQAIRRWSTLGYVSELALQRPWGSLDAPVQAALLAGGAQLMFLSRVPAYAAINETIDWVKAGPAKHAAGVVNAGLRAITRLLGMESGERVMRAAWQDARDAVPLADGTAVGLVREVLPRDELTRWSVACGLPSGLVRAWAQQWGGARARELALHSVCHPPVTLQTRFASESRTAIEAYERSGLLARHDREGCHSFVGDGGAGGGAEGALGQFLAAHPDVWVQDASSTGVVESLRDRASERGAGMTIVDLCAGQGTKTRHLAHVFPAARVIATDADAARLQTLAGWARHPLADRAHVEIVAMDQIARLAGMADVVLLDVPCSNTGVLPRRPEAAQRTQTNQLARLVSLQREIVAKGAALVRSSGVLVYSTCSIDPAENGEQAAWAGSSAAGLGLRLLEERVTLPAGLPGEGATRYCDGAYHARFIRA